MSKKKYKKITARILDHVLSWGDYMSGLPSWTKSDANVYILVKTEVRRLRNKEYLKRKAMKEKMSKEISDKI